MRKSLDEIRIILDTQLAELLREHKIRSVAGFGSYVRGEHKRGSDIDILAIFEEPVSLLSLVGAEQYVSKIVQTRVDLTPQESLRSELRDRIRAEAVPV